MSSIPKQSRIRRPSNEISEIVDSLTKEDGILEVPSKLNEIRDSKTKQQYSATETSATGRVKAFVRIRPFLSGDERTNQTSTIPEGDSKKLSFTQPGDSKSSLFEYDGVLPMSADNTKGTGKTHTLTAKDGIMWKMIENCFNAIQSDSNHSYVVKLSYLQIYNEKVFDLLAEEEAELHIRESKDQGVFADGLFEAIIESASQFKSYITLGRERLVIAETRMNRQSSRSHAICIVSLLKSKNDSKSSAIDIEDQLFDKAAENILSTTPPQSMLSSQLKAMSKSKQKNSKFSNFATKLKGKLILCDLAGSERVKKSAVSGINLTEAQNINSSLLELGNVVEALATKNKQHIPYRNSHLTRLLQESLGGNSKTMLLVCISPAISDASETKSSLLFGSRAMNVKTEERLNIEIDHKKRCEELMALLKEERSQWKNENDALNGKIDQLKKSKQKEKLINTSSMSIGTQTELEGWEVEDAVRKMNVVESKIQSVQDESDSKEKVLKKQLSTVLKEKTRDVDDLSQRLKFLSTENETLMTKLLIVSGKQESEQRLNEEYEKQFDALSEENKALQNQVFDYQRQMSSLVDEVMLAKRDSQKQNDDSTNNPLLQDLNEQKRINSEIEEKLKRVEETFQLQNSNLVALENQERTSLLRMKNQLKRNCKTLIDSRCFDPAHQPIMNHFYRFLDDPSISLLSLDELILDSIPVNQLDTMSLHELTNVFVNVAQKTQRVPKTSIVKPSLFPVVFQRYQLLLLEHQLFTKILSSQISANSFSNIRASTVPSLATIDLDDIAERRRPNRSPDSVHELDLPDTSKFGCFSFFRRIKKIQ